MKLIELAPIAVVGAAIFGVIDLKIDHDIGKLADKLSNAEQHYHMSSVQPLSEQSEANLSAVLVRPRASGESFLICHKSSDGDFTLTTAARSGATGGYSKIILRPPLGAVIGTFCEDVFSRA